MMNSRNNNKAIAKIQIILGIAMMPLTNSACERKDLFLRVDQTQIQVELNRLAKIYARLFMDFGDGMKERSGLRD